MPIRDARQDLNRRPSNAEKAMSANARSRDEQGKAEDRGRRKHHPGPPADDKAKGGA